MQILNLTGIFTLLQILYTKLIVFVIQNNRIYWTSFTLI